MSRHACVVSNRVFLKIVCDLQRPEDWGAGGREVGEVVYIADRGEKAPLLPFFSPFWICEWIYNLVKSKWDAFYSRYIHVRSDNTLLVQLCKGVISRLDNHYRKVNKKPDKYQYDEENKRKGKYLCHEICRKHTRLSLK